MGSILPVWELYGVLVLFPKIGAGGLVAGSVFGGFQAPGPFAPRALSRPLPPALSPNDLPEKNLRHTLRPDLGKSSVFCGVPWCNDCGSRSRAVQGK